MLSGVGRARAVLTRCLMLAVLGASVAALGMAQDGANAPPPPMQSSRPPMERAFHGRGGPGGGLGGRWWDNPQLASDLNLSTDQKKKMEDIFQQNRLKLIDLHASLQKEEVTLEPLMGADSPDEGRVLGQIDKVAQARAELEKSNARMLLAMRQVLTQDQWTKLKAARASRMAQRGGPDGGPGNGGPGNGAGPE
jgi:protein CpxP